MTESPFTPEQQKTLKEDFLPDYLALDSDTARNAHLTTIIDQILKHEKFHGKLGPQKSEKAWKLCISKYFKNRRQTQRQQQIRQEYKATATSATMPIAHDPVNCVKGMRKAAKLFQVLGNENIDGQGFFKAQNEERIRQHASNMDGNPTANFKKALNELWNAELDKASYESQAREYWNVPNNQLQFLVGASRLLNAICQYKHLGKVELMLMYTFAREDGTCDSGCIAGHSDPETTDFSDEHVEAYQSFLEAWSKYGEKYCRSPDPSPQTRFTIPVDSSGRPRFPELDFEKVTGEELREVLSVYFNALWASARRKGRPTYTNIKNNPETFIDSTIHKLPCFGNPHDKEFTRSMVTQLAEYLNTHSSSSAEQPFEFLAESDRANSQRVELSQSGLENPNYDKSTGPEKGTISTGGVEDGIDDEEEEEGVSTDGVEEEGAKDGQAQTFPADEMQHDPSIVDVHVQDEARQEQTTELVEERVEGAVNSNASGNGSCDGISAKGRKRKEAADPATVPTLRRSTRYTATNQTPSTSGFDEGHRDKRQKVTPVAVVKERRGKKTKKI
ncbi:hypothetical protein VKT23_003403 [Stygiomarasmius scandens]|uniref:Uncharacterized protein n=1 Tax=Marasmiellus scandens TaxID=2682957 RepID=A0ABR1K163_9AGAR